MSTVTHAVRERSCVGPQPIGPTARSERRSRRRRAVAWLFSLAVSVGVAAFAGAALGERAPARRYTLDQAVNTFSADRANETDVGYQYWFFDKKLADGRTLKMSVVAPHQKSHPPHRHDGHEFFYVLEGKAEFHLDGKTRVVGPNTGLYCAPWSTHGIRNVGDGELKYLVIKEYVEAMGRR